MPRCRLLALNGICWIYGRDYANLGVETVDMIADILMNDAGPGSHPVRTFDTGIKPLLQKPAKAQSGFETPNSI